MNTSRKINWSVIGIGLGASIGLGFITVLAAGALAAVLGVGALRSTLALPVISLFLSLASHLAVGYGTARAAQNHGVAANKHLLVIGFIVMLLGAVSVFTPNKNAATPELHAAITQLRIIGWTLTFPLLFLGARWVKAPVLSR